MYKLISFFSSSLLILVLIYSYIFEVQFKDIDFDNYKEIVVLSKSYGNRGYLEYKAYNLGTFDLVIHYREDAIFNKVNKTVVNRWDTSACGSEEETFQAVNGVYNKVKQKSIELDWETKICITSIFEMNLNGKLKLIDTLCSKSISDNWTEVDCTLLDEKL